MMGWGARLIRLEHGLELGAICFKKTQITPGQRQSVGRLMAHAIVNAEGGMRLEPLAQ